MNRMVFLWYLNVLPLMTKRGSQKDIYALIFISYVSSIFKSCLEEFKDHPIQLPDYFSVSQKLKHINEGIIQMTSVLTGIC